MSELLVDDEYKNIRIKIDNQIVATQEIIDRVSIAFGCTDGSAPAVGTTYSPHCDVEINSNEIYGDSRLDAIKMGAIFVVECEFEYGTYTPLGRFEIGQPVQITDDYAISFSGEGMLGSVLARKKMNWANMEQYSDKGVLTVAEALALVHTQFPTITIQTPSSEYLPSGFSSARIVVPTSLKKWKKKVVYKKRFVKLTVRDFIAGIAVMMGGNVVEYGSTIRIVTMKEALSNISSDSFTADFYEQDYTYEKRAYAPKEVILKTYETTPVQSKKKSGTTITHGYCYTTECECASVYNPTIPQGENKYTVNVDCQWIGRSFEAFYFSGSVSSDSGIYDDATPIHEYPNDKFDYTPCAFNFSGWNEAFKPSFFINVQGTRKNTETQVETPFTITAYIMEMTFEWNGTISVTVNSGYNGDSSEITVTIGTNELSNAWNNGTNIPEVANVDFPEPIEGEWIYERLDAPYGYCWGYLQGNIIHLAIANASGSYYTYENGICTVIASYPSGLDFVFGATFYKGYEYILGKLNGSSTINLYRCDGGVWVIVSSLNYWTTNGALFNYNGKIHFFLGDGGRHYTFDGNDIELLETTSGFYFTGSNTAYNSFEYEGVLHIFCYGHKNTNPEGNYYHWIYNGNTMMPDITFNSGSLFHSCIYKERIIVAYTPFGRYLMQQFYDEWTELTSLPSSYTASAPDYAVEYGSKIYLFVGGGVWIWNPS